MHEVLPDLTPPECPACASFVVGDGLEPYDFVGKIGFVDSNSTGDGGSSGTSSYTSSSAVGTTDFSGLRTAEWSLEYETGASEHWERITLACVLAVWVPLLITWWRIVFCRPGEAGFKVRFLGMGLILSTRTIMTCGAVETSLEVRNAGGGGGWKGGTLMKVP